MRTGQYGVSLTSTIVNNTDAPTDGTCESKMWERVNETEQQETLGMLRDYLDEYCSGKVFFSEAQIRWIKNQSSICKASQQIPLGSETMIVIDVFADVSHYGRVSAAITNVSMASHLGGNGEHGTAIMWYADQMKTAPTVEPIPMKAVENPDEPGRRVRQGFEQLSYH